MAIHGQPADIPRVRVRVGVRVRVRVRVRCRGRAKNRVRVIASVRGGSRGRGSIPRTTGS